MRKKLLAVLLAAFTVTSTFALTACNGDSNTSESKWGTEFSYVTAYAQAQELGYAGTFDEFIDMISGKDGTNGVDGKDGVNGVDGKDGVNGVDGKDGKDGVNGVDGKDGAEGKSAYQVWLDNGHTGNQSDFLDWLKGSDGINGTNGKDGVNGVDGKDGVGVENATINADGHLIVALTNGKEIDCGIVLNTHTHEFGDWIVLSEADCINTGLRLRICGTCNYTEANVIPLTGEHVWSSWKDNSEKDNHSRACEKCGKTEEASHNIVDYACTDCGKPLQFVLPLQGEMITPYDLVLDVSLNNCWHFHSAIDISAEVGAEIVAASSGTIEKIVLNDKLDGSSITIAHSGTFKTVYNYINVKEGLKVGDKVEMGAVIGTVAESTGAECKLPPHLHFEIIDNEKAVNPGDYLDLSGISSAN